jgi:hypothetical protein
MFERQNDLMRSSQQFMQAKGAIDHENIALKKNADNFINQIESLKEELQVKNGQIIELRTKQDLVNTIIENGTVKNDEEVRRLSEENILLRDRNGKMKEEYDQLDDQYKSALSQHEENKNVLENLLSAVKSKMNKKERERTSLVEINKYLNSIIQNQDQKNIELENKIDAMKRYKDAFKSSSSLQCKGCRKTFEAVLFSPHIKICPKLEQNGLNLQVVECNVIINENTQEMHYIYKTVISFAGDSWSESKTYKEFFKFHKKLTPIFPNDQLLTEYDFEKLDKQECTTGEEKQILSVKRLEFLQDYTDSLNKTYFCSGEYIKLIFDSNICDESSLTQTSSSVYLNIIRSKPAVLQPQNSDQKYGSNKYAESEL